jgi:hypothetical protein
MICALLGRRFVWPPHKQAFVVIGNVEARL